MSFEFIIDPRYVGRHAYLSPSSHVLDRDRTPEELDSMVYSKNAANIGTCIHATCADLIGNHIRPSSKGALYDILLKDMCTWGKNGKGGRDAKPIPRTLIDPNRYLETCMMYVRDALTYDMTPEVPMFLSDTAGGTADAISYNERKRYLRIHDLKTGTIPAKMDQLEAYAAFFFLYYKKKPGDMTGIELRIYQNGEALIEHANPEDISPIMDRIVTESNYLNENYV